jgi:siroheme synthase
VKSVVKKGFVYLVGAGPGRIDLITVRGAEVLRLADCVIYDKLATDNQ